MAPWTIAAVALLLNSAYLASTASANTNVNSLIPANFFLSMGMERSTSSSNFDRSGRPSLVIGNVADDISRVQPRVRYAQPPHLFRQVGKRRFDAVTSKSGPDLLRPMVARGAAFGDYDRDGDLDVLVTINNGAARLLRNGGTENRALRLSLRGTTSNRDAIGARVLVRLADGPAPHAHGEDRLELLVAERAGPHGWARRIRICRSHRGTWPSGRTEKLAGAPPGQTLVIEEGRGIVGRVPFAAQSLRSPTGPR